MIVILAVALAGCVERPSLQERELVSSVEQRVKLPSGVGSLRCYERHYALLQGRDLDELMGEAPPGLSGRKLLIGSYVRGPHPGVHWAKRAKELPQLADAGCSILKVYHLVGDRESSITATCSLNVAGAAPERIDPPVTC